MNQLRPDDDGYAEGDPEWQTCFVTWMFLQKVLPDKGNAGPWYACYCNQECREANQSL